MKFWDPKNKGEGDIQPGFTRFTLEGTFEGKKFQLRMDIPSEILEEVDGAVYAYHVMRQNLGLELVEYLDRENRINFTSNSEPESWFR